MAINLSIKNDYIARKNMGINSLLHQTILKPGNETEATWNGFTENWTLSCGKTAE